jgi:hypothetical protein
MLVVKPNLRRMRAFVDSPAERGGVPERGRVRQRLSWEPRLLLAAGAIGAVAVVAIILALH